VKRRAALFLSAVIALSACGGSHHSNSSAGSGTTSTVATSTVAGSTVAPRSGSLSAAIAATRRGGSAEFSYTDTAGTTRGKTIFTAKVHGVVDFASGNTSFGYAVANSSTPSVAVDDARGVGGTLYVRVPDGYGVATTAPWATLDPGHTTAAVSVNVSTPEKIVALTALLDYLGSATNVQAAGAHGFTFQIRTDQQAVSKQSAAVGLLILGPNTSGFDIDVGPLNATGTARLDNAGRLARVEIDTLDRALGGRATKTFTFDHYGVAAPPGAPNPTEIASTATLCVDKKVDLLGAVKSYRAAHGARTEPTAAQLAAAGLLRQPAAWRITYTDDADSHGFFGVYQNPWCPGSLG
jgi:hypothetical protein